MATQIGQRKRHFTEDAYKRLDALPRGAWKHRKQRKVDLSTIIDDLARINALPMQFKNLRPDAVQGLVSLWKRRQLAPKTMQNRVGLLRQMAYALNIPLAIPSNAELKIQGPALVKTPISATQIDPLTPLELSLESMIQDIFMLQYLFGLKARECMLLESSMITKAGVHVARGIAYNKHDRDIPAVTPEQQSFIEKMHSKKHEEFSLKEDRSFRLGLVNLYAYAAKKLKLKHPDHFRHQFIKNRFLFLKQSHSTPDTLNIIKAETGYSKLVEIKSILKELKVIEL